MEDSGIERSCGMTTGGDGSSDDGAVVTVRTISSSGVGSTVADRQSTCIAKYGYCGGGDGERGSGKSNEVAARLIVADLGGSGGDDSAGRRSDAADGIVENETTVRMRDAEYDGEGAYGFVALLNDVEADGGTNSGTNCAQQLERGEAAVNDIEIEKSAGSVAACATRDVKCAPTVVRSKGASSLPPTPQAKARQT